MKIKNIYIFISFVLLLGTKTKLIAQCNYNISNNTVSIWDWRQEFYTDQMYIMIANNPSNFRILSTVRSPFWPPAGGSSNSNLSRFYTAFSLSNSLSTVDCQPTDGWELLAKEFGTPTDPKNCPFFCLYNRYTGVIRAFFLMGQIPTSPQNGAKIQMLHVIPDIHRESAIFSHLYPITKTVEEFIKGTKATNPNYYVNQQDYWQYADFPMAFDPCVCSYPSKIQFRYETMATSVVELTASITGFNKQITGGSPNNVLENQNAFDVAAGAIKSGVNGYKDWNEALDKMKEQADKQEAGTKSVIKNAIGKLGDKAQYIPYVGAAMGVIDFFVSLNKDNQTNTSPLIFQSNLQFNGLGTISQTNPYQTFEYWTPGSNQNVTTEKTIYDNPLGVWSVLKPIITEYVDYTNSADNAGIKYPPARQYKIKEDVKYALNPSSNLTVKNVQASLILKYKPLSKHIFDNFLNVGGGFGTFFPKPVGFKAFYPGTTTNMNFEDRVKNAGLDVEQFQYNIKKDSVLVTLRTPYVPLACFSSTSLFIHKEFDNGLNPKFNDIYDLYAKFIVKLERNDNSGKEVIIVITYNITKQSSSFNYGDESYNNTYNWPEIEGIGYSQFPVFSSINNGNMPALNSPFAFVPTNIFLENEVVNKNILAWNSITIGNNVTFTGPITLKAGNEIIVNTENIINPEVVLELGHPIDGCNTAISELQHSQDEINQFCSLNGSYDNHSYSSLGKGSINLPNKNKDKPTIEFNIYPNPANDFAIVTYKLNGSLAKNISIYNLAGTLVKSVNITGNYEETIKTEDLAAGVYFVTLASNNGETKTQKLVITK